MSVVPTAALLTGTDRVTYFDSTTLSFVKDAKVVAVGTWKNGSKFITVVDPRNHFEESIPLCYVLDGDKVVAVWMGRL